MRFLLFLIISTLGTLLAYPLVPVAVLFCDKGGRLPWLFKWLETHDALGWSGPLTEHATTMTTQKYGQRVGLVRWLWRNKAYTLRYWLRARVTPEMTKHSWGNLENSGWGFSHWYGQVGPYWEYQPTINLGDYKIYMRIGWKMTPYFKTPNKLKMSAGIFSGLSFRTDDRDG